MKISIIGCGWVGQKLAPRLFQQGHHVVVTTTSPEKLAVLENLSSEAHLLDFGKPFETDFLEGSDALIFSMPVSREQWHAGFEKLAVQATRVIFFSSTGIYPQLPLTFEEDFSENLRADILASENLIRRKFPQAVILRFGGLMGAERSVKNMFANRAVPNLGKRVNHIHYEDILEIVKILLQSKTQHLVYNIVAPLHPTLAEILNVPDAGAAAMPQRLISPARFIQEFNYNFIHPNPVHF